jgi:VWFA-related protein
MLICAPLFAQQPTPPGNVTFSVGTSLVQVDAEVTDAKHRHVTDLKADDFEVFLDHKLQPVTNFAYVRLDDPNINSPAASGRPGSYIVRPEDVHRSMVIVVDDLGLSFPSMAYTRQALHKFIDREMQPGDLIALWETGRSNSVFQQFTSDKHVLDVAIDNLNWNLRGRGLLDAFGGDRDPFKPDKTPTPGPASAAEMNGVPRPRNSGTRDEKNYLATNLAMGALSTIDELMDELQTVGGRKAVVLFSDGIDQALPTVDSSALGSPIEQALLNQMRHLIDKANRSGTVIYTVDVRGLLYMNSGQVMGFNASQQALVTLAEQTGGFATLNTNDLADAMKEIDEDQKGYYLIGFKAPLDIRTGKTTEKIDFHTLHLRVTRPGLHIRSRTGFWAQTDEAARTKFETPEAQMSLAMLSLFNRSDIHVRLTALYTRTADGKPAVRNLLYVSARDISFQTTPTGKHTAALDLMIVANGSGIDPLAQVSRKVEIEATGDQLKKLQEDGILLTMNVPIKHPGPYQIRASVRDSGSKAVGSAGQYIDVPDVKRRHLALTTPLIGEISGQGDSDSNKLSTALREFHAGSHVSFVSLIETDRDSNVAAKDFDASVRLYCDGKPIMNVPLPVVNVRGEDVHALRGQLVLKDSLPIGQYYLEATATQHSGKTPRTATSWIDFQVVP